MYKAKRQHYAGKNGAQGPDEGAGSDEGAVDVDVEAEADEA